MIRITLEPVSGWIEEGKPLFKRHWEEVANFKETFALAPDLEKIVKLEDAGLWHSWTARSQKDLIGYLGMLVTPMLHYARDLSAYIDVVYVLPEHRKGGAGLRLIMAMEQAATALGIGRIIFHSKLGDLDMGPLLEKRGYVWTEKTYERVLKGSLTVRELD